MQRCIAPLQGCIISHCRPARRITSPHGDPIPGVFAGRFSTTMEWALIGLRSVESDQKQSAARSMREVVSTAFGIELLALSPGNGVPHDRVEVPRSRVLDRSPVIAPVTSGRSPRFFVGAEVEHPGDLPQGVKRKERKLPFPRVVLRARTARLLRIHGPPDRLRVMDAQCARWRAGPLQVRLAPDEFSASAQYVRRDAAVGTAPPGPARLPMMRVGRSSRSRSPALSMRRSFTRDYGGRSN